MATTDLLLLDGCDICGENHNTEDCPELVLTEALEDSTTTRARLTLPNSLLLFEHEGGNLDVITKEAIPHKSRLGPLEAKKTTQEIVGDDLFVLKIFSREGGSITLDTSDENECNWLSLISCANDEHSHNLMALQIGFDIYFTATRHIEAGEKLCVWYAPYYAKKLGKSPQPTWNTKILRGKDVQRIRYDFLMFDGHPLQPPALPGIGGHLSPSTGMFKDSPVKLDSPYKKIEHVKAPAIPMEAVDHPTPPTKSLTEQPVQTTSAQTDGHPASPTVASEAAESYFEEPLMPVKTEYNYQALMMPVGARAQKEPTEGVQYEATGVTDESRIEDDDGFNISKETWNAINTVAVASQVRQVDMTKDAATHTCRRCGKEIAGIKALAMHIKEHMVVADKTSRQVQKEERKATRSEIRAKLALEQKLKKRQEKIKEDDNENIDKEEENEEEPSEHQRLEEEKTGEKRKRRVNMVQKKVAEVPLVEWVYEELDETGSQTSTTEPPCKKTQQYLLEEAGVNEGYNMKKSKSSLLEIVTLKKDKRYEKSKNVKPDSEKSPDKETRKTNSPIKTRNKSLDKTNRSSKSRKRKKCDSESEKDEVEITSVVSPRRSSRIRSGRVKIESAKDLLDGKRSEKSIKKSTSIKDVTAIRALSFESPVKKENKKSAKKEDISNEKSAKNEGVLIGTRSKSRLKRRRLTELGDSEVKTEDLADSSIAEDRLENEFNENSVLEMKGSEKTGIVSEENSASKSDDDKNIGSGANTSPDRANMSPSKTNTSQNKANTCASKEDPPDVTSTNSTSTQQTEIHGEENQLNDDDMDTSETDNIETGTSYDAQSVAGVPHQLDKESDTTTYQTETSVTEVQTDVTDVQTANQLGTTEAHSEGIVCNESQTESQLSHLISHEGTSESQASIATTGTDSQKSMPSTGTNETQIPVITPSTANTEAQSSEAMDVCSTATSQPYTGSLTGSTSNVTVNQNINAMQNNGMSMSHREQANPDLNVTQTVAGNVLVNVDQSIDACSNYATHSSDVNQRELMNSNTSHTMGDTDVLNTNSQMIIQESGDTNTGSHIIGVIDEANYQISSSDLTNSANQVFVDENGQVLQNVQMQVSDEGNTVYIVLETDKPPGSDNQVSENQGNAQQEYSQLEDISSIQDLITFDTEITDPNAPVVPVMQTKNTNADTPTLSGSVRNTDSIHSTLVDSTSSSGDVGNNSKSDMNQYVMEALKEVPQTGGEFPFSPQDFVNSANNESSENPTVNSPTTSENFAAVTEDQESNQQVDTHAENPKNTAENTAMNTTDKQSIDGQQTNTGKVKTLNQGLESNDVSLSPGNSQSTSAYDDTTNTDIGIKEEHEENSDKMIKNVKPRSQRNIKSTKEATIVETEGPKIKIEAGSNLQCSQCGKKFSKAHYLERHIEGHNRQFECKFCHKRFTRKESFDRHECKETPSGKVSNQGMHYCDICGAAFQNEKYLMRHMAAHTGEFTCRKCKRSFARKEALMKHLLQCNQEQLKEDKISCHPCEFCARVFTSETSLQNHVKSHSGMFKCEKCDLLMSSALSLQRHQCTWDKLENGMYRCTKCGDLFKTPKLMKAHKLKHKSDLVCAICDKGFARKQTLVSHILECSTVQQLKLSGSATCSLCGVEYTNVVALRKHLKEHSHQFQCKKCGKSFLLQSTLEYHSCSAEEEDRLMCEICQKVFINCGALIRHMAIHTGGGHTCARCNRTFISELRLTNHICKDVITGKQVWVKRENGELPVELEKLPNANSLVCPTCGKSFSNTSNLNKHILIHSEKKQICDVCGAKFHQKISLQKHKRFVHSTEYQDQCADCGKVMKSRSSLYAHYKQFHAPVQTVYSCKDCGKSFRQKCNLKKHVQTKNCKFTFKCDVCPETFTSDVQLDFHKQWHDNGEVYKCDQCILVFQELIELLKHQQRDHHVVYMCQWCGIEFTSLNVFWKHLMVTHTNEVGFPDDLESYSQTRLKRRHGGLNLDLPAELILDDSQSMTDSITHQYEIQNVQDQDGISQVEVPFIVEYQGMPESSDNNITIDQSNERTLIIQTAPGVTKENGELPPEVAEALRCLSSHGALDSNDITIALDGSIPSGDQPATTGFGEGVVHYQYVLQDPQIKQEDMTQINLQQNNVVYQ